MAPVIMENGEPFFFTYMKNGQATLNRIHADCLGWTAMASASLMENASDALLASGGNEQYILLN